MPEKEIESLLIRSQADAIIFEDSYIDIIKRIKEANKTKVKEYICMNEKNEEVEYIYDLIEKGKELIKKDSRYVNANINEKET